MHSVSWSRFISLVSVFLFLFLSAPQYLCLSLSFYIFICLSCLSLSLSLSFFSFVSVFLFLFLCICLSFSLSLSLSFFFFVSVFLFLSLTLSLPLSLPFTCLVSVFFCLTLSLCLFHSKPVANVVCAYIPTMMNSRKNNYKLSIKQNCNGYSLIPHPYFIKLILLVDLQAQPVSLVKIESCGSGLCWPASGPACMLIYLNFCCTYVSFISILFKFSTLSKASGCWPNSDPGLFASNDGRFFKLYWINILDNFKSFFVRLPL